MKKDRGLEMCNTLSLLFNPLITTKYPLIQRTNHLIPATADVDMVLFYSGVSTEVFLETCSRSGVQRVPVSTMLGSA